MSDVIQKKKLAKALTKIEKCSLGKWSTGRTDGKTEEVVLMEDVESIILELLNESTTKNDLGVDCISRKYIYNRLHGLDHDEDYECDELSEVLRSNTSFIYQKAYEAIKRSKNNDEH